ncbi:unnamed protein product [Didymodactylos carnosus]|uniref:Uncharacterized protein n=1 Tax=Didymodactylos carnosus TaxID=1234261 RepID=A0A815QCC6_9BILA|nr:unnamed protein product [Didymodactylos carnosus]CAF4331496.1 unnamed protein product [Didymodactylos carnosus]
MRPEFDEQPNELPDDYDELTDEQTDMMIYGYDYIFREHDYCFTKKSSESTTTLSSSTDQIVFYVCETRKETARRYINDIQYLLFLSSIEEFEAELKTIHQNWSSDFVEYFSSYVLKDINELELTEWRTVSLDGLVLLLNHLQEFYTNEISRGYCGLDDYRLKPSFSHLAQDKACLSLLEVCHPNDLVLNIQNMEIDKLHKAATDETNDTPLEPRREKPMTQSQLSRTFNDECVQFDSPTGTFIVEIKSSNQITNSNSSRKRISSNSVEKAGKFTRDRTSLANLENLM